MVIQVFMRNHRALDERVFPPAAARLAATQLAAKP